MTSHIDKMTLQLLTNKRQYQKYLTQTDPQYNEKQKTHIQKLEKYRGQIMKLFESMIIEELENRESKTNNEMVESFQGYLHTCIKYIEMRKWDEKTNGGCYETGYASSGDEFFPEGGEEGGDGEEGGEGESGNHEDEEYPINTPPPSSYKKKKESLFQPQGNLSFWGKAIKKSH